MKSIQTLFTKPALTLAALATVGAGIGAGALASAQTATSSTISTQATRPAWAGMHMQGPGMGRGRGVIGTVSAINGNTITVTREDGTTYTVDASNATVSKIVTEPVTDITVGERIEAHGTVSGTSVTAAHIMAGIPQKPPQAQ